MARIYANQELYWTGDELFVQGRRAPLLRVVPDVTWPDMWRVECPDWTLTDMANRTRAREAGRAIALQRLNRT
jgi:hypothetical protein